MHAALQRVLFTEDDDELYGHFDQLIDRLGVELERRARAQFRRPNLVINSDDFAG